MIFMIELRNCSLIYYFAVRACCANVKMLGRSVLVVGKLLDKLPRYLWINGLDC